MKCFYCKREEVAFQTGKVGLCSDHYTSYFLSRLQKFYSNRSVIKAREAVFYANKSVKYAEYALCFQLLALVFAVAAIAFRYFGT